jgi:photosystem II stability/assembly factor-like uncharacterized protein
MCVSQAGETELLDVMFANGKDGMILGQTDDFGFVLVTHDGGRNWSLGQISRSSGFDTAAFQDSSHWWVAGQEGILMSSADAGATWTAVKSGTDHDITKLLFGPSGRPFAIAKGGVLLTSHDGGRTWTHRTIANGEDLYDITFLSTGRIIILTLNHLFCSDDKGETWKQLTETSGPVLTETSGFSITQISFFDDKEGLLRLSGGGLGFTNDGGATVRTIPAESGEGDIQVSVTGKRSAYLLKGLFGETDVPEGYENGPSSSTVLRTMDRGKHWKVIFHLEEMHSQAGWINRMVWNSSEQGWLVGEDSVFITEDTGKTWTRCRLVLQASEEVTGQTVKTGPVKTICSPWRSPESGRVPHP